MTKTLRAQPADKRNPHMVAAGPGTTIINGEKWADLTAEQWINGVSNAEDAAAASGRALPNLTPTEQKERLVFHYDPAKCNRCMLCVTRCPYTARELRDTKVMTLDEDKCRSCGYCVSLCRHGALTSDRLAGPA